MDLKKIAELGEQFSTVKSGLKADEELSQEQLERMLKFHKAGKGSCDDWLNLEFPSTTIEQIEINEESSSRIIDKLVEKLELRKEEADSEVELLNTLRELPVKIRESENVLVELQETIESKRELILKLDEAKKKQLKTLQIEIEKATINATKDVNVMLKRFLTYPTILKKVFETWERRKVPSDFYYLALIMMADYDPLKRTTHEIKGKSIHGIKFNMAYFKKMLKMLPSNDVVTLWEFTQVYKEPIENLRKGYAFIVVVQSG